MRELVFALEYRPGCNRVADALAEHDVTLGALDLTLPPATYRELRRRASIENRDPGELVSEALERHFEEASATPE